MFELIEFRAGPTLIMLQSAPYHAKSASIQYRDSQFFNKLPVTLRTNPVRAVEVADGVVGVLGIKKIPPANLAMVVRPALLHEDRFLRVERLTDG